MTPFLIFVYFCGDSKSNQCYDESYASCSFGFKYFVPWLVGSIAFVPVSIHFIPTKVICPMFLKWLENKTMEIQINQHGGDKLNDHVSLSAIENSLNAQLNPYGVYRTGMFPAQAKGLGICSQQCEKLSPPALLKSKIVSHLLPDKESPMFDAKAHTRGDSVGV
ncbi:hypothetical protein STEG23_017254, partial [Scotinomys teguina]